MSTTAPIHPVCLITSTISTHRRPHPFHGRAVSKRGSEASVARIRFVTGAMYLVLGAAVEDVANEVITHRRMGRWVGWWVGDGV